MKLSVDPLSETPTPLSFEDDPDFWGGIAEAFPELPEPAGHLRFELKGHRMGEGIYLEGQLLGDPELVCGRCLARYRGRLREPFRLVLEPAGARVPVEPDAAAALERDGVCLSDELESGWFSGSELDLGAIFREVIALALPVQPLCREDCKGLCPRCGVDRNAETCQCSEIRPDSPFAALARLRRGETGGDA